MGIHSWHGFGQGPRSAAHASGFGEASPLCSAASPLRPCEVTRFRRAAVKLIAKLSSGSAAHSPPTSMICSSDQTASSSTKTARNAMLAIAGHHENWEPFVRRGKRGRGGQRGNKKCVCNTQIWEPVLVGSGTRTNSAGQRPSLWRSRKAGMVRGHKDRIPKRVRGGDFPMESLQLLRNICYFPLLVLKGIHHYWTYLYFFSWVLIQMEES